jgi:hypothetical protein
MDKRSSNLFGQIVYCRTDYTSVIANREMTPLIDSIGFIDTGVENC